jgi:hypothetical protein
MLRKFRISRMPQSFKTSDGKFFINIDHTQSFNSHTSSGNFSTTATLDYDLKDIQERLSLNENPQFRVSKIGIIVKYNRIESIGEKLELNRSHFLDIANNLSSEGLKVWIHNYNYYLNDHKNISFMVESLDHIYENSILNQDETFLPQFLESKNDWNASIKGDFRKLFNFHIHQQNKFHHQPEYTRKKELLKSYISVFSELSLNLHHSEIKTFGEYTYSDNIKRITNFLLEYQVLQFEKSKNKKVSENA